MSSIIKFILYGNYGKRTYNNYKEIIDKNNIKGLKILCIINILFNIFLFIIFSFINYNIVLVYYNILSVLVSLIYMIILKGLIKEKYITIMFYIYIFFTVIIYKILSTDYNIDVISTIMCVLYISNVVLFIDKPYRYNIIMFLFITWLCIDTLMLNSADYITIKILIYVATYMIGVVISYFQYNNIIEKAKILIKTQKERDQDLLTKLNNRVFTERYINEFLLENNNSGVMFIFDLDNFKEVNDTYGHIVGDGLLIEVANIIKRTFRKGDCISRLGGDEFAIFIEEINSESFAVKKAQKLIEEVKNIKFEDKNIVGCSIGIAFSERKDDFNSLFKKADEAMYEAKKAGKSCYKFYKNKKLKQINLA